MMWSINERYSDINKRCGCRVRLTRYAPDRLQPWPLTLKLVCESYVRWGTFLPNLGMLGLCVLDLFAMYAAMDRQTDGRTDKSNAYSPLRYGRGIITTSRPRAVQGTDVSYNARDAGKQSVDVGARRRRSTTQSSHRRAAAVWLSHSTTDHHYNDSVYNNNNNRVKAVYLWQTEWAITRGEFSWAVRSALAGTLWTSLVISKSAQSFSNSFDPRALS